MKQTVILLGALLMALPCSSAKANETVSASRIAAEIRAVGAERVLSTYYDSPAWSSSIMPGIGSASPAWLAVAERLRHVADGGASEDLGIALYQALAVAPFRVLPVLTRSYGGTVEQRCNVSFEAEVPTQGVAAYLGAVRAKLAQAKTTAERSVANACLRGLEQSLAAAKAQGLT